MEKINISDPDQICVYPLSKKCHDDETILYHGTSSVWADKIESEGFKINDPPYSVDDIARLVTEFEEFFPFLSYPDSVSAPFNVLKYYTSGQGSYTRNKLASFTSGYFTAVDFASAQLGETINRLLMLKERFIEFTQDEREIAKAMNDLRGKIDECPTSRAMILRAIEKNEAGYTSFLDALSTMARPYEELADSHYPVIFVLKPPPESMLDWDPFERHRFPNRMDTKDEVFPREDISPETFLYRVDFPNGPKTELDEIKWQNTRKILPWETELDESKND
jgi:hypothetical protein